MSAEKMRKALESIRSALRVDDPHGHYDLVCEALAQADQRGDSVPCAWRAYGARHWNDGPPNQQSIDYYGTNIEYAYTAPPAPVVPELLDDTSLRAVIGRIGNEVHNLSCEQTSDDRLASRLSEIAGDLWKLAQQASPAPLVPDGWKLVPVEMTQEMEEAAFRVTGGTVGGYLYTAMLAAAPEAQP